MEIEIRSVGEAIIRGYVNVVERCSQKLRKSDGTTFIERIAKGAFGNAIESAKSENRAIKMLVDHEDGKKLADSNDGLVLREDNVGLFAEAVVRDERAISRIRAGDAKGWSFGFRCLKDKYEEVAGEKIRTVEKLWLNEISLIFDKEPCYQATSVEVRAGGEVVAEVRGYSEDMTVVDNIDNSVTAVYKNKCDVLKLM